MSSESVLNNEIRNLVLDRMSSLESALRSTDSLARGIVSVTDFRKALYFAVGLPYSAIPVVMATVPVTGGTVNYEQWIPSYILGESSSLSRTQESLFASVRRSEAELLGEIQALIRTHYSSLESAFRAFDRNGDGLISMYEFKRALYLHLGILPAHIDALFKFIDANDSGYINYLEFMNFMNADFSPSKSMRLGDSVSSSSYKDGQSSALRHSRLSPSKNLISGTSPLNVSAARVEDLNRRISASEAQIDADSSPSKSRIERLSNMLREERQRAAERILSPSISNDYASPASHALESAHAHLHASSLDTKLCDLEIERKLRDIEFDRRLAESIHAIRHSKSKDLLQEVEFQAMRASLAARTGSADGVADVLASSSSPLRSSHALLDLLHHRKHHTDCCLPLSPSQRVELIHDLRHLGLSGGQAISYVRDLPISEVDKLAVFRAIGGHGSATSVLSPSKEAAFLRELRRLEEDEHNTHCHDHSLTGSHHHHHHHHLDNDLCRSHHHSPLSSRHVCVSRGVENILLDEIRATPVSADRKIAMLKDLPLPSCCVSHLTHELLLYNAVDGQRSSTSPLKGSPRRLDSSSRINF